VTAEDKILLLIIFLDIITIASGIIFYYFMRRYVRKRLQRKDLGFKNNLILIALSFLTICIVNVLLNFFNTAIFMMMIK